MDKPLKHTPYNTFVYMLNIINILLNRKPFIIADPRDNSITLSKRLFKHIKRQGHKEAKIFVFAIPDNDTYGFAVNPDISQETVLAALQYNSKHKSIGFESLCPTVNKIFYDYKLPDRPAKLSVGIRKSPDGRHYYEIIKPQ